MRKAYQGMLCKANSDNEFLSMLNQVLFLDVQNFHPLINLWMKQETKIGIYSLQ
jgi:hypothetical protein